MYHSPFGPYHSNVHWHHIFLASARPSVLFLPLLSSSRCILHPTPKVNFKKHSSILPVLFMVTQWHHATPGLKPTLHPVGHVPTGPDSCLLSALLFPFSHSFKSLQPKWPPFWSSKELSSSLLQGLCTWNLLVAFSSIHVPGWFPPIRVWNVTSWEKLFLITPAHASCPPSNFVLYYPFIFFNSIGHYAD